MSKNLLENSTEFAELIAELSGVCRAPFPVRLWMRAWDSWFWSGVPEWLRHRWPALPGPWLHLQLPPREQDPASLGIGPDCPVSCFSGCRCFVWDVLESSPSSWPADFSNCSLSSISSNIPHFLTDLDFWWGHKPLSALQNSVFINGKQSHWGQNPHLITNTWPELTWGYL